MERVLIFSFSFSLSGVLFMFVGTVIFWSILRLIDLLAREPESLFPFSY